MKIYLDIASYASDYRLNKAYFQLFKWYLKNEESVQLLVPQIVIPSVTNMYRKGLSIENTRHAHCHINLKKYIDSGPANRWEMDVEAQTQNFQTSFINTLQELGAEIIPLHDIMHMESLTLLFQLQPLFETTYAHGAAWGSLVKHCFGEDNKLVLVSNHIESMLLAAEIFSKLGKPFLLESDFFDCSRTNDKLLKRLNSPDAPGNRIDLIDNLSWFNRKYVLPKLELLHDTFSLLQSESPLQEYGLDLESWIFDNQLEFQAALEDNLPGIFSHMRIAPVGSTLAIYNMDVNPSEFNLFDIYAFEDEQILINLNFNMGITMRFYANCGFGPSIYGVLEHAPIKFSVSGVDDFGAWLYGEMKLPLNLVLLWDQSKKEVGSSQITYKNIYKYCKHCGEPIFKKFEERCPRCMQPL